MPRGVAGSCYYKGDAARSGAAGDRCEVEERGGSGRSRLEQGGRCAGVVTERCATGPWSVARVTRCQRSSSWRALRQVSPAAFSITRRSSSASQHSWMWARMRSSRWWITAAAAARLSCRASRVRRRAAACRPRPGRRGSGWCRRCAAAICRPDAAPRLIAAWSTRSCPAGCGAGSGADRAWSEDADQLVTAPRGPVVRALDQLLQVRDEVRADLPVPLALFGVAADHEPLGAGAVAAVAVPTWATWISSTRRLSATVR